jgi:hypothetical protein
MEKTKKQPKPDTYRDPKNLPAAEPERRHPDKDSRTPREPGFDEETGVPAER